MYFYWDNTYILVLLGAIISLIASASVKSTFQKYSRILNRRGLTAQDAASMILHGAGITDVRIERVSGSLSDHYSPKEKVLRLSDSVYGQTSVAALGVAAHECGHAIQHARGYAPLKLRSASVPLANIGSMLSWPLLVLGIVLGMGGLATAGVVLFTFVVAFQVITLPVEFNASRRALAILEERGMLSMDEMSGAKKVLSAAAMTYVAAVASSLLQLLRLVLLARRSDD
ncbi:MAG: zinc metallopeptidase [Oscillospiraceae bacterium]|nr:zinc metallopeptidase [Oscillospiraceae bacterium]